MVYAEALSEAAIADGVRAGHTYVKLFGNDGPDLRLEAAGDEGGFGIMGDVLPDSAATLTATAMAMAMTAAMAGIRNCSASSGGVQGYLAAAHMERWGPCGSQVSKGSGWAQLG